MHSPTRSMSPPPTTASVIPSQQAAAARGDRCGRGRRQGGGRALVATSPRQGRSTSPAGSLDNWRKCVDLSSTRGRPCRIRASRTPRMWPTTAMARLVQPGRVRDVVPGQPAHRRSPCRARRSTCLGRLSPSRAPRSAAPRWRVDGARHRRLGPASHRPMLPARIGSYGVVATGLTPDELRTPVRDSEPMPTSARARSGLRTSSRWSEQPAHRWCV